METRDEVFCLLVTLRCPERCDAILGALPEARREFLRGGIAHWTARPREDARARLAWLAQSFAESGNLPDAGSRLLRRYLAA
jgi:hypothetical protein